MMNFLANPWNSVKEELEKQNIPFRYKTTSSPKMEQIEEYRVVRIKKDEDGWEFVLADSGPDRINGLENI